MSENTGLPPGDPLGWSALAGRWSFGYDMPDDLGGGFVCGELLLRSDGVLLRRYGGSSCHAGQITWKYGPWAQVSWWTGETGPQQAVALLKSRGYDLLMHDQVPSTSPLSVRSQARRPLASRCDTRVDCGEKRRRMVDVTGAVTAEAAGLAVVLAESISAPPVGASWASGPGRLSSRFSSLPSAQALDGAVAPHPARPGEVSGDCAIDLKAERYGGD